MEALRLELLVEHADYARLGLLSLLLLFPRGQWVRLVVALFAGLELAYAIGTGADQPRIIGAAVLLGLALLIFISGLVAASRVRLSAEEQAMAGGLLSGIGRGQARHFIDQGYWLNGRPGEVLLREGEPVTQFCYLAEGEARVQMAGRPIGFCRGGDVIGGLGFFSGEAAGATVILATPARFWCAPAERLTPYFEAHTHLRRTIQRNLAGGEPPATEATALGPEPIAAPSPA
ncbi:MAG TPA: cyclic nucleotide-binding domain-containing protein [Allosphingosinicella sp.]|nr:cyclic nucleotide-binding domain-containing protein [Allosphingosinicella sp.]